MQIEFLEDAPDEIYPKRGNIYFAWNDGRKITMPIDQARIAGVRLQRALHDYDAKSAKVIRFDGRHAAAP